MLVKIFLRENANSISEKYVVILGAPTYHLIKFVEFSQELTAEAFLNFFVVVCLFPIIYFF